MLHPARWVVLALSARTFALAALAQTPLPDSFNPGADNVVDSLAVQAEGKILVGGNFTTLSGQDSIGIGRLNADGTLDTSFNSGVNFNPLAYHYVLSQTVQADGKILVGGAFTTLGAAPLSFSYLQTALFPTRFYRLRSGP